MSGHLTQPRGISGDWDTLLKNWFECPSYAGVYVLGSFARYVTLYSQQVRALNLVAALHGTRRLEQGTKVAVVGGGAAGMTAAAAAAVLGAEVVLFERLEGLMEIQRNNRQRWIHPHIYDWPDNEFDGDSAHLPLLNWTADYAERVAQQIEQRFESIAKTTSLVVKLGETDINLDPSENGHTYLYCSASAPTAYPIIIMAVGFGLEPENEIQDSYWAEDDFDGNFRQNKQNEKWLVSGHGDGAFTDVMRLCLRRFRHAEIKDLFASEPGYLGVIDDLRKIHNDPLIADNEILSREFGKLSANTLQRKLEARLRQDGPKVYLTGTTNHPYGSGASVLNRLIVLLLTRLKKVTLLPGPFQKYKKKGALYKVTLGRGTLTQEYSFHRVILRHGPNPKALEEGFEGVWKACADLSKRWLNQGRTADLTRKRLWSDELFPSQKRQTIAVAGGFESRISTLGVRAAALAIYKEIRTDGSSSIKYEIDRLTVEAGQLSAIRIAYRSATGIVGRPELDSEALLNGLTWEDIYEPSPDLPDEAARMLDRARKLEIKIKFRQPLTPEHPPIRFAVSFTLLNGDALSAYEYEQMYSEREMVHVDKRPLREKIEYFSRAVWFPIEHLRMRLTLPSSSGAIPKPSHFQSDRPILDSEIITDDADGKTLHLYPQPEATRQSSHLKWLEQPQKPLIETGRLQSPSPQIWELTIHKPAIGSYYSIDWQVRPSASSDEALQLDLSVEQVRSKLLRYSRARRAECANAREGTGARQILLDLFKRLTQQFGRTDAERFESGLRTYDSKLRRLIFVDGLIGGAEPKQEFWDIEFPFGIGLAGACFKDGNNPYVYLRHEAQDGLPTSPQYYLDNYLKMERHEILLAIPLMAPGLPNSRPADYEPSRVCGAILEIGSTVKNQPLESIAGRLEDLRKVIARCQNEFENFCAALSS